MRAIDADELSKTIKETCLLAKPWDYVLIERTIADAPTIELERKKGRWIMAVGTSGIRRSKCSECGKYYPHDPEFPFNVPSEYNYCPNCGAYMGGDT